MTNPNDGSDARLRHALEALPEPPLPDALWAQVARGRHRQLARRRTAWAGGLVAVLALLVLPGRLPTGGHDPFAPVVADARTVPVAVVAAADHDAQLRTLDRELQAAYRRGSGDAEIAQLWEARAALVRDRDAPARGRAAPVRPVRI